MAYKAIHLPVGYQVAIKASADHDWIDLGVTKDAGSLEFTYDAIKVTGSQAEPVLNYIKNMVMNATFSLYQQELSLINRIMSGATQYSTVAGTLVSGQSDVIASGAWNYSKFIPIPNQNGDGSTIAITSVTGGTDGALVSGTDYVKIKSGDKWGIIVLDSATVTTEAQTITIVYAYTPSAKRVIKAGSKSTAITPVALRIRKGLASGKYWTCTIYAATSSAGLTFSLPRYDDDEPNALEVTMEGQLDTTRSEFDQLFMIEDEVNITDI